MKSVFVFICFLVSITSFGTNLKKPVPPVGQELARGAGFGNIVLVDTKKQNVAISNLDQARVVIKYPAFFSADIGRLVSGQKILSIFTKTHEFNFYLPASSLKKNGDYSVHQKYTGQKYHLQISHETKDLKSTVSEKVIDCTYTTDDLETTTETDSDGNSTLVSHWVTNSHWGRQLAKVDDQVWLEKMTVLIYDSSNQLNAETPYSVKTNQNVLKELSRCQ